MCERLENSNKEDADQLHHSLCTDYPDLNFTVVSYNPDNESLTLEVTESEFNSSNAEKLRIKSGDKLFQMRRNGQIYNTSNLLASNETSIFNDSIEPGDHFTIVRDGFDSDGDGIEGVDFEQEDYESYILRWDEKNSFENRLLDHMKFRKGDFEYSQRF